jgi:hypothetical protein
MEFVFETRTSMKSFANSFSNGSILWTLEGTPKSDLFFKGLSFRHFFQDLKAHLNSVFPMTFQNYVRATLEYNRTSNIMESQ